MWVGVCFLCWMLLGLDVAVSCLRETDVQGGLQHSPAHVVLCCAVLCRAVLCLQVCKEVQESHGKMLKDWIKGITGVTCVTQQLV